MKYATGFRTRPSLKLGFDLPRELGTIVLAKYGVGDCGVGVFRVYQKAIDIEDAGTNWWEAALSYEFRNRPIDSSMRVFQKLSPF